MASETRARLGLFALLLATLFSFEHLFASGAYWGPAALGMALAAALTIALRRWGWSSTLIVAVASAALVVYLCLVFEAPRTFYGLPTARALRHMGAELAAAYRHSLVDFAPVPLRPGYALATTGALWLITVAGELATFRWKRPMAASVAPIALFAVLMITGGSPLGTWVTVSFLVGLLTYWGLESSHRLRAWGRWVTPWRDEGTPDEGPSMTGDLARRMGVACVLVAFVVPLFVPALEEGLLSWRNSASGGESGGEGSGATAGGLIDPLVSVVPELITQTDRVLFTVETDLTGDFEVPYWRLRSLVEFNGLNWWPRRGVTTPPLEFQPVGVDTPSLEDNTWLGFVPHGIPVPDDWQTLRQRYRIEGLEGQHIPAAGLARTMEVGNDQVIDLLNVDPTSGDLLGEASLSEGFEYLVESNVPDLSFRELQRARIADIFDPVLTQLPAGLDPRLSTLLAEWTRGARTPFDQLVAIQDNLTDTSRFTYSLDVERSASSDYLARFLFETREGYCQQYATAFAVLARMLGYPTRVVVGFLPGETDPARPNRFVVRGTDTHAWPEVLFAEHGWVRFEPTPRGAAGPPAHTVAPVTAGGGLGSGASGAAPGKQPAFEPGARDPRRARDPRLADPRDVARVPSSGIDQRWLEAFRRIVTFLFVAGLLLALAVPGAKWWVIRRRYARAAGTRDQAGAAFSHFELESVHLVGARSPSESARAFARRVGSERDLPRGEIERLADLYERSQYAASDLEAASAVEARRLARALAARLWRSSTIVEKLRRLFSPSGLTSGA